jgi:hypothetical protein
MSDEQTPREKIAKLAAMSPEEFNRFMLWNFTRICKQPLLDTASDTIHEAAKQYQGLK